MTAVRVYGARDCAACARALALVHGPGRSIRERDLVDEPLTWDELHDLAALAGGVRHLLCVQAPAYRALGLAAGDRSEPALLALMASDPSLLRRPIVLVDDLVLVGFDGATRVPRRA